MRRACLMGGFDKYDEDAKDDVAFAPKFNASIEAINETARSGPAEFHEERPSWLPSGLRLMLIIRAAACPLLWETFADMARLVESS